jgi:hypothetical protein
MELHVPAPSSSASASDDLVYQLAGEAAPKPIVSPSVPAPAPVDVPEPLPAQPQAPVEEPASAPKSLAVNLRRKRRRRSSRFEIPAWMVSLAVHIAVLVSLAAFTFSSEAKKIIANINSALVATPKGGEPELLPIYADPGKERSKEAVGNEHAETVGGSAGPSSRGAFGGIGTGPPSATPVVAGVGSGVGEKTSLPGIKLVPNLSGLSLLPAAPGLDLGGGGMIAGDVTYEASDVGASLDQIAREILRHLAKHKLTVVWLFDESESMIDDQKAIREKFDRVATELKANIDNSKKAAGALTHAIVGFGEGIHYELENPTIDIDQIGRAIAKLRVDDTGTENTMHAITEVVNHYSGLIKKDRKVMIVLVTDESGDDGGFVEEAHQAAVGKGVPIYVIGRQSLFGYERAHLRFIDPVTKDVYWPAIHRGPETADIELLQWDGLHERWDEQPSGFAPYELGRLARDTGGIYFLLPSEENMRGKTREKAYKIADLKEYMPDYKSRLAYMAERSKSEFRRTLYEIIQMTKDFSYPRHFPIDPALFAPQAAMASEAATQRLEALLQIQKRLESLQRLRDREPEKRWQAHYDLMLAQVVVYQIKSYEYRACLEEMLQKPPRPKMMPNDNLVVEWVLNHSKDRKAPRERTEKKYLEAKRLLEEVIARHPTTPWADLAQDEFDRGFGVQRDEWHHSPQFNERNTLVPKF